MNIRAWWRKSIVMSKCFCHWFEENSLLWFLQHASTRICDAFQYNNSNRSKSFEEHNHRLFEIKIRWKYRNSSGTETIDCRLAMIIILNNIHLRWSVSAGDVFPSDVIIIYAHRHAARRGVKMVKKVKEMIRHTRVQMILFGGRFAWKGMCAHVNFIRESKR